LEPGPALHRLQEAILRQDASLELQPPVVDLPPELDAAAAPGLVGRRAELAWLWERWERARSGAGALVAVIGPRGIGKSRLAAELAGEAHGMREIVLYAAGAGPAEAVLVAVDRAREATRPTLLVIDDADQAGPVALAGLEELTSVLATVPVLVLATGEDTEALTGLSADGALTLEPIDAEAVREIARRYAPDHGDKDVPTEWLLDASGGIPSRVHDVASQWARREAGRRPGRGRARRATLNGGGARQRRRGPSSGTRALGACP
jgi:hypothetical protein